MRRTFVVEMQRFLPPRLADETLARTDFWTYLMTLLDEAAHRALAALP